MRFFVCVKLLRIPAVQEDISGSLIAPGNIPRKHTEITVPDQHQRQPVQQRLPCKCIRQQQDQADRHQKLRQFICPIASLHKLFQSSSHLRPSPLCLFHANYNTLPPNQKNVNDTGLHFTEISDNFQFVYNSGFCGFSFCGKVMIAANRSSDTRREKPPPCSSVRLLAIERPSPLPSVFRLRSPRTKRPMSSSAETCSASFAVFATVMMTCSASVFTVTEKLLFSFAYLHRLPKRFSSTRQNCRPSA